MCIRDRLVRVFTTVEVAKKRRRMIAEPIINVFYPDGGEIELTSLADILDPVNRHTHAMTLDFPWFYGQMSIPDEAQPYYCFTYADQWYALTTVPTGARHVPAVAEALTKSLGHHAVHDLHDPPTLSTDEVCHHTYIDNTRFTALDPALLRIIHRRWVLLCSRTAITLDGEGLEGAIVTAYDFLGVHCVHQPPNSYVRLTEKMTSKLAGWTVNLPPASQLTLRTLLQCMGACVWASRVLAYPLAAVYHLFKFSRRRVAAGYHLDSAADPWSCVISLLVAWLRRLIQNNPRRLVCEGDQPWTLFTDACLSGYGIIALPPPDLSASCSIFAGPWTAEEHINILEARATLIGVLCLPTQARLTPLLIVIDNTTVLGAGRKTHSRSFTLNAIVRRIYAAAASSMYHIVTWDYIASEDNPADQPSRLFEAARLRGKRLRLFELL